MDKDKVLEVLLELKEDVGAIKADVKEISLLKQDVKRIEGRINLAHGIALAAGALFSLFFALLGKFVRFN